MSYHVNTNSHDEGSDHVDTEAHVKVSDHTMLLEDDTFEVPKMPYDLPMLTGYRAHVAFRL